LGVAAHPRYFRRVIDGELDAYLAAAPEAAVAVALEGARAIGKTSTAGERAATRYELDHEAHLALVAADVDLALSQPAPVLIDEWQHHPPVWDRVRRAVDRHAPAGRRDTARRRVPRCALRVPGHAVRTCLRAGGRGLGESSADIRR
jgi:hypothetical protein